MTDVPVYPLRFARLVKVEHTVFALPFAYVGAFLAVAGVPSAHDLVWITVAALVAAGLGLAVGPLYWAGVAVVAALLAYEHALVRPGDLRRLDAAFFTMNGVISIGFFVLVLLDVL